MIDSNPQNSCLRVDDFLYCGVPKFFLVSVNVKEPEPTAWNKDSKEPNQIQRKSFEKTNDNTMLSTPTPNIQTNKHLSGFSVNLQDLINKDKKKKSKLSPSSNLFSKGDKPKTGKNEVVEKLAAYKFILQNVKKPALPVEEKGAIELTNKTPVVPVEEKGATPKKIPVDQKGKSYKELTNKTPFVSVKEKGATPKKMPVNLRKKNFQNINYQKSVAPIQASTVSPRKLGTHLDISFLKKYESAKLSVLISLLRDMHTNVIQNNACSFNFDRNNIRSILKRIFVDTESKLMEVLVDFVVEKLNKPYEPNCLSFVDICAIYIMHIRSISLSRFLEVQSQIDRVEESGFLYILFEHFGAYYCQDSCEEFFKKLNDLYVQNPFPFLHKDTDIVEYVGTILSCMSNTVGKDQTTILNILYCCLPYLSDDIYDGIVKKYNQDLLHSSTNSKSNTVEEFINTLVKKWLDKNKSLLNQFRKDLVDNKENNFFTSVGKRLKVHKSFLNRENILHKYSVDQSVVNSIGVAIFIDLFHNNYNLLDCQKLLTDSTDNLLTYQSTLFQVIVQIYKSEFNPLQALSLSQQCIDLFRITDFSKLINRQDTLLSNQQNNMYCGPEKFSEILLEKFRANENAPNIVFGRYINTFCHFARNYFDPLLQIHVVSDISLDDSKFTKFVLYKLSNSSTMRNSKTELKKMISMALQYRLSPYLYDDNSYFDYKMKCLSDNTSCSYIATAIFNLLRHNILTGGILYKNIHDKTISEYLNRFTLLTDKQKSNIVCDIKQNLANNGLNICSGTVANKRSLEASNLELIQREFLQLCISFAMNLFLSAHVDVCKMFLNDILQKNTKVLDVVVQDLRKRYLPNVTVKTIDVYPYIHQYLFLEKWNSIGSYCVEKTENDYHKIVRLFNVGILPAWSKMNNTNIKESINSIVSLYFPYFNQSDIDALIKVSACIQSTGKPSASSATANVVINTYPVIFKFYCIYLLGSISYVELMDSLQTVNANSHFLDHIKKEINILSRYMQDNHSLYNLTDKKAREMKMNILKKVVNSLQESLNRFSFDLS